MFFKIYFWKWREKARFSRVIRLTRIDLKADCILCVLASGKEGKKKKSRHQLHPATSVSPSQDTEGSEINLAAAPKIEHQPPLEQDAGCVGTSRGHCGQQSYFCSATGPPGVDAHSFIQLPVSREGDTHRDAQKKINVYTPTSSANRQSVGVGCVPFGETYCDGVRVAKVFGHLGLCIWVYLYTWAACWCLSWRTMETHLAVLSDFMPQTHCFSVCVCFFNWQCSTSWLLDHICLFLLLLLCLFRWFTLTYRQGCTSNAITKTLMIQKRNAPKDQQNDFLSSPFPSFVFGDSRTLHLCLHTHTHTHQ